MSFKPEVKLSRMEGFAPLDMFFATPEEARHAAVSLQTIRTDFRVTEGPEPVTHTVVNGNIIPVSESRKWIIVIGDPVSGFEFVGPFPGQSEANKHGGKYVNTRWCASPMQRPGVV